MKSKPLYRLILSLFLLFPVMLNGQDYSGAWVYIKENPTDGYAGDVVVDEDGYSYVTGSKGYETQTLNWTIPFTHGVQHSTYAHQNIFIEKIDPDGNVVWSHTFLNPGGASDQYNGMGKAITLDGNGNIYVTGFFQGLIDFNPGTGTAYLSTDQTSSNLDARGPDVFILKLTKDGEYIWAKNISGKEGYRVGNDITVDNLGNVYTVGYFQAKADFNPGAGFLYQESDPSQSYFANKKRKYFIQKLDGNGNFVWVRTAYFNPKKIITDNNRDLYLTGHFQEDSVDFGLLSADYFLSPTTNSTHSNFDIYLLKLNENGDFIWVKNNQELGVNSTERVEGTDLAVSGNTLILGTSREYFCNLDFDGNILWSKNRSAHNLAVNATGNIFSVSQRTVAITNYYHDLIIYTPSGAIIDSFPVSIEGYFLRGIDVNDNEEIFIYSYTQIRSGYYPYNAKLVKYAIPTEIPSPNVLGTCPKSDIWTSNDNFTCTPVANAQGYQWIFVNGTDTLFDSDNGNTNLMSFDWVPGIEKSKTYAVQVRAKVGGAWGEYGEVCHITTMTPIPGPTILGACPKNNFTLNYTLTNSFVYVDGNPINKHMWIFVDNGDTITYVVQGSKRTINLYEVPGLQYNKTYSVRVRAKIGCHYGEYGPSCNMSLALVIPTTAVTGACPKTDYKLTWDLNASPVTGAEAYRWSFVNGTDTTFHYTSGSSRGYLYLGAVPGLQLNTTYNVFVQAQIGGKLGPFGAACSISTLNIVPTTSVVGPCPKTGLGMSSVLQCVKVHGASNYHWIFVNGNDTINFYRGYNNAYVDLAWVNGLAYNKTYSVQVRALINGSWGAFGSSCSISTASSIPTAWILPEYCGVTVSRYSEVKASYVANAEDFQYIFVNGSDTVWFTRGGANRHVVMYWVTGLENSTSYSVQVRAKVGGEWGNFGNTCSITTASDLVLFFAYQDDVGDAIFFLTNESQQTTGIEERVKGSWKMYPNPSSGEAVTLSGVDNINSVEVYNELGALVARYLPEKRNSVQISTEHLSRGIYWVRVVDDSGMQMLKLIIAK